MYKFKNVKKLLIEFSRGEGLSVPTDSIKFVKVDGDELSGVTPGGSSGSSSDGAAVKSFMTQLLSENDQYSNCVAPDAYFWDDEEEQRLIMIESFEQLLPIAISTENEYAFLRALIPVYYTDTVPVQGESYITPGWVSIGPVQITALPGNDEYGTAGYPEGYVF